MLHCALSKNVLYVQICHSLLLHLPVHPLLSLQDRGLCFPFIQCASSLIHILLQLVYRGLSVNLQKRCCFCDRMVLWQNAWRDIKWKRWRIPEKELDIKKFANYFIVTSQFAIVCFCVFIFKIHTHASEIWNSRQRDCELSRRNE
jgi:hypothetical protein